MTQLNDIKAKVLAQEGFDFAGASIDDMEVAWLRSATVAPTKGREHITDLWMFYLWELGFTQANITERKIAFMTDQGATGDDYNDIELSYWALRGTP